MKTYLRYKLSCQMKFHGKNLAELLYALSIYRSQNVLCRSKFWCQTKKFIYILWQSQKFCARPKDDLHSVKLVFVFEETLNALKVLGWLKKFGPAQNILGHVKGKALEALIIERSK